MSRKLRCLYEYEVDFNDMTEEQKHNYINERDGEIVDGIGVNSDGHEFRDDNGLALFVEEVVVHDTDKLIKNKEWIFANYEEKENE